MASNFKIRTKWGQVFRQLRLDKRITLSVLEDEHGLNRSTVCKHERGVLKPKPDVLVRYAELVGLKDGTPEYKEFIALGLAESGILREEFVKRPEEVLRAAIMNVLDQGFTINEVIDIVDEYDDIVDCSEKGDRGCCDSLGEQFESEPVAFGSRNGVADQRRSSK